MNYNNLCYRCFFEKPIKDRPCPKCGYQHYPEAIRANCLRPGTLLHKRYIIGIALGIGGFGITYKCLDTKIGGICAIKEYFPANFAMRNNATRLVSVSEQNVEQYNHIMKRFVEEANLVRKLKHRNIVTIYDSFFENNTAYYVMEYCDGIDLRRYTNNFKRKLGYDEGLNILYQIMNGLEYIHSKGILHRDIAPDNIYITKNNSVKILDFGSARSEMDQYNREFSVIVKVGYAPIEQYGGRGKQGPYTDIYALGATFYHLFTSKAPIESTQRVAEDTMEEFSRLRPDLPDNLKYCIEKAMELTTAGRISSIPEMKRILGLENNSVRITQNDPMGSRSDLRSGNRPVSGSPNPLGGTGSSNSGGGQRSMAPAELCARAGAYAIDLGIWMLLYFLVLFGNFGINGVSLLLGVLFPVLFMLINTVSEILTSTTIGKAMLSLYVRGKTGAEAEANQILLRNLVKMAGFFVAVFSQNGELLEDKITDTVVCIKR